ncbi:MAG TPA: flagellar motor stator protein MotA [Alphaproteobacteria bacterium]|nr:flagellar motor stator protein MotA [Alphaproteobacteria bacterium]
MILIIGLVIVLACVVVPFVLHGGSLAVLWQPFELITIGGAAIGAFIISNPKEILSHVPAAFGVAFKGGNLKKEDYLELLTMLFCVFKLAKMKGALALEAHIEKPEESAVFKSFPKFMGHHHAVVFFCDYMRMLTMGSDNPHQMSDLMDEELDVLHHEHHNVASAIQTMADGLPALGIVAAVMGVINTMGAISQPPEILGRMIGAALVGTFLGILMSYGMVGPIAAMLTNIFESEHKYFLCIKAGILAYMNGYAPAIAIEFARKSIESDFRPNFYELEQALQEVPTF